MNRIITVEEAARDMTDAIKSIAQEAGVPEVAVAVIAGAMLGAPIAKQDLQRAADEITAAYRQQHVDNPQTAPTIPPNN